MQLQTFQGSRTNDDWNPLDPEAMNDWKIQGLISWGFNMFRNRETIREQRALQGRAFVNREQEVEGYPQECPESIPRHEEVRSGHTGQPKSRYFQT